MTKFNQTIHPTSIVFINPLIILMALFYDFSWQRGALNRLLDCFSAICSMTCKLERQALRLSSAYSISWWICRVCSSDRCWRNFPIGRWRLLDLFYAPLGWRWRRQPRAWRTSWRLIQSSMVSSVSIPIASPYVRRFMNILIKLFHVNFRLHRHKIKAALNYVLAQ